MPEHIVAAAVLFRGVTFPGLTHYDCRQAAADQFELSQDDIFVECSEGFLTNLNRFVTRDEAYQIAKSQNQIRPAMGKDINEPWLDYAEIENDERFWVDKALK